MTPRLTILLIYCFVFSLKTNAQSTDLWGTSGGGKKGNGIIFKTNSEGNGKQILHEFTTNFEGGNSTCTDLVKASNGRIYGFSEGGKYGYGLIFEYDPDSLKYMAKACFDGTNGAHPVGALIEAKVGFLYGVSRSSSNASSGFGGALFEYDIENDSLTSVHFFSDSITNRQLPSGSLVKASNGNLYGLLRQSDRFHQGALYEYSLTSNSLRILVNFQDTISGRDPIGSLIQAQNGKLYGLTRQGGNFNSGVLFEYDIIQDTLIKRVNFENSIGVLPENSLLEMNGKLFGTTTSSGLYNEGTLFEYDLNTKATIKKHDFSYQTVPRRSHLKKFNDSTIIGTQSDAGPYGLGLIYLYNPLTEVFTEKFYFTDEISGKRALSSLLDAGNGQMLGLTNQGGTENTGVIYQMSVADFKFEKLVDFNYSPQGRFPSSSLLLNKDGLFYGVTSNGGIYGKGTLYSYNPKLQLFEKQLDFNDTLHGAHPSALYLMDNGKFYGICLSGGKYQDGVLFEYNPDSGTYTKKVEFGQFQQLRLPQRALVGILNESIYGVTYKGGLFDTGGMYEYNINTDTYAEKSSFPRYVNGLPLPAERSLLLTQQSQIFGTDNLSRNFTSGGSIFEYDYKNDSIIYSYDFSSINGEQQPAGGLIEGENHKIYGTTLFGGEQDFGSLFEYDYLIDSLVVKNSFIASTTGFRPNGALLRASNHKIYGSTIVGGQLGAGTLYEYDIELDTMIVKESFDNIRGRALAGSLIEVSECSTLDTRISISNESLMASQSGSNYQWLDCSNNYSLIPNEVNQIYRLTDTGYFAVKIMKGTCIDTSACISFRTSFTKENHLSEAIIFPNPFNDFFHISYLSAATLTARLYDITGTLIQESHFPPKSNYTISPEVKAGIYLLELNRNGNTERHKLIKF